MMGCLCGFVRRGRMGNVRMSIDMQHLSRGFVCLFEWLGKIRH